MKLFIALTVLAAASAHVDVEAEFASFAQKFGKTYEADEFFRRFHIFSENLGLVTAHNAGDHSYTLGINAYSDLTSAEFAAVANGYIPATQAYGNVGIAQVIDADFVPEASLDWRTKGAVTPVKDQGQCGSCWAFSTTGSLETAAFTATGTLASFSEQQLVDCAKSAGNNGCQGGLMDNAFKWIEQHGLCSESAYPYTARDGITCRTCTPVVHLTGFVDVQGEAGMMAAVAVNTVSIAIEADQSSFQHYRGGVFNGPCGTRLDHGVLLVGYGTDNGSDYWIVKNSWGASWGESGYIRFARNVNMCGLGNAASYPTGASA